MAKIMKKILLASGNAGKLKEIQQILASNNIELIPQADYSIPEVEETGLTFVENAILKARNAAQHSGLPALADDSGVEVDALQGAPGIYSARFAGPEANPKANLQKVLELLKDVPEEERTARFQCCIVLMRHAKDPSPIIAQGTWEGSILPQPMGDDGFAYDPIFFVPTHHCSAAQLPAAEKNRISHRARALQQLTKSLAEV